MMENFHGRTLDDYRRLKAKGELEVGSIIRVYDYEGTSTEEPHYVVGRNDVLFRGGKQFHPRDVLSRKAAPKGWCLEGYDLDALPEEELRAAMDEELI